MPITNEHLADIERSFDADVLAEIFAHYAKSGGRPSEKVCEALGRVYGKTVDEIEAAYAAHLSTRS